MTRLTLLKAATLVSGTLILSTTVFASENLSPRQVSIIEISADTASGNLETLRKDLVKGLESGLTVNEIKEILTQLYAYTGFPRSLNGINTFMDVMNVRQKEGIKDEIGKEASPLPKNLNKDQFGAQMRARIGGRKTIPAPSGYQVFAPTIDTYLKEHLFCDIFARDNLDHQSRELATVGALAAMTGTEGQLRFHLNGALNMGMTPAQMKSFVNVISQHMGAESGSRTSQVLEQVLSQRGNK